MWGVIFDDQYIMHSPYKDKLEKMHIVPCVVSFSMGEVNLYKQLISNRLMQFVNCIIHQAQLIYHALITNAYCTLWGTLLFEP